LGIAVAIGIFFVVFCQLLQVNNTISGNGILDSKTVF
jgi:hypothetical protein